MSRLTSQIRQPSWRYWLAGIRLYIAIGIVLATFEIWWWAQTAYGGDLAVIRMQEVYAWLSLALLGVAVTIGPVYKLLPKLPGAKLARESRRLVGIGAAWFASLHVGVTYLVLFHASNPLRLPVQYKQPFAVGVAALILLLALAATSFDAAFKGMGIWWFRLHRTVYLALALIVIHILMIGVHATSITTLAILAIGGIALIAMHSSLLLSQSQRPSRWQVIALAMAVIGLILVGNYGIQQYISRYDITAGHSHAAH